MNIVDTSIPRTLEKISPTAVIHSWKWAVINASFGARVRNYERRLSSHWCWVFGVWKHIRRTSRKAQQKSISLQCENQSLKIFLHLYFCPPYINRNNLYFSLKNFHPACRYLWNPTPLPQNSKFLYHPESTAATTLWLLQVAKGQKSWE